MPDTPLKTAFLQLPTRILKDLAEGKPPQALAAAICRFSEGFLPGRIASIMTLGRDGLLNVYAAPSAPSGLVAALKAVRPGPHAGSCGNAVYCEQPVIVSRISEDARWNDLREVAQAWQLQSCWSYPVWLDGQVAGTFALTAGAPDEPLEEGRELMAFCSAMTGTILRYAELRRQEADQRKALARALQFNAMLAQVNQVLASVEYPHELFQSICDIAIQYGHMKLAYVGVPNAGQRVRFIASAGETGYLDGLEISIDPSLPIGQGSFGLSWRTGLPRYNDSFATADYLQPWQVRAARFGMGASASIPILRQGMVRAVLSVYHPEEHIFDDELRHLLEELGLDVGRGLERIFLRRRLEHEQNKQQYLSIHDGLTGLPNRLALEHHLSGALARARKDQTVLALCLADVDDFKPVNEIHGRAAGDHLLKTLARRLRATLRDTDLVARSGGDEFVLVVEGLLRYEDIFPRLTDLERALTETVTLPDGTIHEPRVSMGMTFYPDDGGDAGQLMRHAFEAMYGLKPYKEARAVWWQIWGEGQLRAVETLPRTVPPYGPEAAALMRAVAETLAPLPRYFANHFHTDWTTRPSIAEIMPRLGASDQAIVLGRMEQHLQLLQRPDLHEAEHRQQAETLGRCNTLLGLDHTALIEASQNYLEEVRRSLHGHQGMRLFEKQQVADVLASRLRIELQSQLHDALQQLLLERQDWLSTHSLRLSQATSWVDACRDILEGLTQLDSCEAAAINRLDASGKIEYEFKSVLAEQYLRELEAAGIIPHLQDIRGGTGRPAAHLRVWRSEAIETNISYATEPHLEHLRPFALGLGIRSAAFIPITDAQGRIAASLGVFGRHPGQFESAQLRLFLQSLGHLLSQTRQRLYRPQLTGQTAEQRRLYRDALENGGLLMHYQPIVDMNSGLPIKIEALARLRLPDDSLSPPGIFLPGFGVRELVVLFRQGLDLALAQLQHCLPVKPDLVVSLNLPPAVLIEPDCVRWVEAALEARQVAPRHLELEVLEDEEFHDLDAARGCLQALSALGVGLVMDDLGAGYSSLVRLRNLPFTTVKIDQGLVREIALDPERVIDFISGLVRLAKSLRLRVIVEGLESAELVEVASLLGVDEGQGYALSKPLTAEQLGPWLGTFRWLLSKDHPVTALGTLAQQKRGY